MTHYQVKIDEASWRVFRFPYEPVDSNMYFIPDEDTGIVFDPNESEELLHVFERYGTKRIVIVLTHEHFDHTSGTVWLQSKIDTSLFCQKECAASIASNKGNDPKLVAFVLAARDAIDGGKRYSRFKADFKKYTLSADMTFEKEYILKVGNIQMKCCSSPGHSPGSALFLWSETCIFTGDSFLQTSPVIVRFPESDKTLYNEVTLPFLKSLDKNMLVFPGHGAPFTLSESNYL